MAELGNFCYYECPFYSDDEEIPECMAGLMFGLESERVKEGQKCFYIKYPMQPVSFVANMKENIANISLIDKV